MYIIILFVLVLYLLPIILLNFLIKFRTNINTIIANLVMLIPIINWILFVHFIDDVQDSLDLDCKIRFNTESKFYKWLYHKKW